MTFVKFQAAFFGKIDYKFLLKKPKFNLWGMLLILLF